VISVIVPVHDEERTIALLYEELESALEPLADGWEVVFVDDGSSDGSFAALTRLHNARENVRVVRLRRNFGKATALAAGFAQAQGDIVVTIDADLQDDPAEIPRLLARLSDGYGVVSGWKRRRRDSFSRRAASKLFNWATRRLSRVKLHDFNCGLKAYSRECAREIAGSCYGELHRYLPVLAYYKGFAVTEMEVNHRERKTGRSRYGLERYVRGFLDLLTAVFMSRYTRRPMHVFGGFGLLLFIPGAFSLFWLAVLKLAFHHVLGQRPLLIMGAVLCISGLQLMLTGLLAEMISGQRGVATVPYEPVVVVPGDADGEPLISLPDDIDTSADPFDHRRIREFGK
jgi:glycosyltransferase involved in cell wall biosynthesis